MTRTTKQTTKLQGKAIQRNYTVTYHLPDDQNHESKVCKLMFMLTLGILEKKVRTAIDKKYSNHRICSKKNQLCH